MDRVLELVGPERVSVISGLGHGREVRDILPDLPEENIILEPVGRNTAAACGLGAWWLKKKTGGGVMAVLPADHLIADEDAFRADLAAAAEAAEGTERLITFGLKPSRPETGYGYLERGAAVGEFGGKTLFELSSFKEKPDLATAEAYLADGKHFWNAGMFVWEAEAILGWIEKLMPDLAAGLAELAPALLTPDQEAVLAAGYPRLQKKSIDFGVMERAEGKYMIAAEWDWSDVGSWQAVYELSDKDEAGNALTDGTVAIDSTGNLVEAEGKTVALLGVSDLVIVDTGDALLVMDRSRAQEVAGILDALKAKGRHDLL